MMTFLRVCREDSGYSDGDPTVGMNAIDGLKAEQDVESIEQIQQEIIEMQSVDGSVEEMKEELVQNAVDYAAAAGEEKPEAVAIDGEVVAEIPSDVKPSIEVEGASEEEIGEQVKEKVVDMEITGEHYLGKIMKMRKSKAQELLGIYGKRSKIDLQAITANPLGEYAVAIEGLGETIKKIGENIKKWFAKIIESFRAVIAKYTGLFRNAREQGDIIRKKFDDIKRPELKNDEKGDWSEKFIVYRLLDGNPGNIGNMMTKGTMSTITSSIEKSMQNTESNISKGGHVSFARISRNTIEVMLGGVFQIGGSTLKGADVKFYSASDTNLAYDADEISIVSLPSNSLTVVAYNTDNLKEYNEYLKDQDKDARRVKLSLGNYRIQFLENSGNKKKQEEKIPARDLKAFGIKLSEYLRNCGRIEEEAKRCERSLKKIKDIIDNIESAAAQSGNHLTERGVEDFRKLVTSMYSAAANIGTFPKLTATVALEALNAIKDGDKE